MSSPISPKRDRKRPESGRGEQGPIWGRPEPGARRPRYTREQIAAKALEIADSDGFEAVSMRRLASELGAGTMTLYHYVRTKDELIQLMDDTVMAEVVVPEGELSEDWREALSELARRSCASLMRHRWVIDSLGGARPGPNSLRHFEQSLAAVSALELPLAERLEVITLVDDFVFGYAVRSAVPGFEDAAAVDAIIEYTRDLMATGDFPRIDALMGELVGDDRDVRAAFDRLMSITFDESRFERGLARLIAGIELGLKQRP